MARVVISGILTLTFLLLGVAGYPGDRLLRSNSGFNTFGEEISLYDYCDVPVLHQGDFWNYTATASEETLGVDLNGYLNTTVQEFKTPPQGRPYYLMRTFSHLEGEFSYIIYRISVTVTIIGTTSVLAEDLSTINTSTTTLLELDPDPLSLSGTYFYNATFSPPPEDLDFPLLVGKAWNVSSRAEEGTSWKYYNSSYVVRGLTNVTVPAGVYLCWEIFSPAQSLSAYYSPVVRGFVRREVSTTIDSYSLTTRLELSSYHISPDPPVQADPAPPYHTLPSRNLTIHFENVTASTQFILWGVRGNCSGEALRITTPAGPDNSPSNVDYGSFGLLLYDSLNSTPLWAGSVVTHNYNLVARNVTPTELRVFEGEQVEVKAVIENPSTEPLCANYTLFLDTLQYRNGSATVESGGSVNISLILPPLSRGKHTLQLVVDPENNIEEIREDDNTLEFTIEVLKAVELELLGTSPAPGEIWIDEGDEILFTVRIQCEDNANLTTEWIISGEVVDEGLTHLFQTDYNASEHSPYFITFHAAHPLSPEEVFVNWTVYVRDVNRPPAFQHVTPPPGNISISASEYQVFSAIATDPDGDEVETLWLVNGTVYSRGTSINFSSSPGVYKVTCVAHDGRLNTSLTWIIEVRPLPEPARVLSKEPNSTLVVLNEGDNITFRVDIDPGEWQFTLFHWYLNGSLVSTDPEYLFTASFMGPNSSTGSPLRVLFRAEFVEGVLEVNWTVIVVDVNRDPVIENVTVVFSGEWADGEALVNLTFRGYDPDGDPINVTWIADGVEVLYSPNGTVLLPPGRHIIILNVTDGRGGVAVQVRVFDVPEEKENGLFPGILPFKEGGRRVFLFALSLIVMLLIIWVLMKRSQEGSEEYYE